MEVGKKKATPQASLPTPLGRIKAKFLQGIIDFLRRKVVNVFRRGARAEKIRKPDLKRNSQKNLKKRRSSGHAKAKACAFLDTEAQVASDEEVSSDESDGSDDSSDDDFIVPDKKVKASSLSFYLSFNPVPSW
ncbi:unnamed protein product [Tilletia laevis]|uniref:Uncharacterized protein n=3 Tax=Tilletia TaxID=13289 RepID=A0A8X7MWI0_9BASI|nr:hypothetical protein CF336_g5850 [Tilletia laevis]KAE8251995.1 hypothetical protein A4X06_0g2455 [Tilletia controversa]KAE8252263.1 hypothetical protein A4X03_0g6216 [Tilletia caries]KAE8202341.1 hypothetical protein CF335_g3458 [Tilletia laevis]CAD6889214.1 unnamed protein product [Tilletia caries]